MDVAVTRDVLDCLTRRAKAAHPQECCGILTGIANRITAAIPAANVHPSPETHFEIDPATLIAAHRATREGGDAVLGYYHSHPNGPAQPSAEDQAQASGDGRIWAIIGKDLDVALWRDDEFGFTPLPYSESDG